MDDAIGETVLDELLGGKLKLRQPRKGHRAGTDAILLAAATPVCGDLIDLGAGVGTAGLAVALRQPQTVVRLVEKDPAVARLAQENIGLNGLAGRVEAIAADALDAADRRRAGIAEASADVVICNPPFYSAASVRISPDARRAAAHVVNDEACGGLVEPWLRCFAALTRPSGRMVLIHRVEALGDILRACEGRFGDLAVRPIHPRADAPALRLLVSGIKGSRAPLRLLPGFVLHQQNGDFSLEAEAVNRGEALIGWI